MTSNNFQVGQTVLIKKPSPRWPRPSYGHIERIEGNRIYVRLAVDSANPTAWDTVQFGANELLPDTRR